MSWSAHFRKVILVLSLGILVPGVAFYMRHEQKQIQIQSTEIKNATLDESRKHHTHRPNDQLRDVASGPTSQKIDINDPTIPEALALKEIVSEFRGEELSPEAQKRIQERWSDFKKMPVAYQVLAMNIRSQMGQPSLDLETAGYLEVLAQFPGHDTETSQLAEQILLSTQSDRVPLPDEAQTEAELNESLSTDAKMILPTVAHEVLMETTADDQVRFDLTVKAIDRHGNHNVQVGFFEAYLQTNPNRRAELLRVLNERGHRLPVESVNSTPE